MLMCGAQSMTLPARCSVKIILEISELSTSGRSQEVDHTRAHRAPTKHTVAIARTYDHFEDAI